MEYISQKESHLDWISLDAVGTFLHLAEPVASTYAKKAIEFNLPFDSDLLKINIAQTFSTMPPMQPSFEKPAQDEKQWWREFVSRSFDIPMHQTDFDLFFESLFETFSRKETWSIHRSFKTLLINLKQTGYQLGIISNFDGRLYTILEQHQLLTFFDVIILPRHAGTSKPNQQIFDTFVQHAHTMPGKIIHLGNEPEEDITGARNAGLHATLWHVSPSSDFKSVSSSLNRILKSIGD